MITEGLLGVCRSNCTVHALETSRTHAQFAQNQMLPSSRFGQPRLLVQAARPLVATSRRSWAFAINGPR